MIKDSVSFRIVRIISLICGALFVIIPVIPLIFISLKTRSEYSSTPYMAPPENFFNFYNYAYAMKVGKLLEALGGTMVVMFFSLLIGISFTCMVAYAINRFDFKIRKVLVSGFTMTMFIPVVTTQVVVFRMIYAMGLYNNIGSLILLYSGVSIVDLYILLNLLNTLPREMDEAALIDGANLYQGFFYIILPLLKPGIATIAVLKGVGIYNDFYLPNLYLGGFDGMKTITVAVYKFYSGLSTPFEVVSAAVIIATIPMLIAFLFLQQHIYNGLGGAVKS